MEGEENEAELLEEVCPVVTAAEVLGLMQENLAEFVGGEALKEIQGEQDFGSKKADDAGVGELVGGANFDIGGDAGCEVGRWVVMVDAEGGVPEGAQTPCVPGEVGQAV